MSQPLTQVIAGINDRDRLAHLSLSQRLSLGIDGSPFNQSTALAHYNTAARIGAPGSPTLSGYGLPVIRARRGTNTGTLPARPLASAQVTPFSGTAPLTVMLDASTASTPDGELSYFWVQGTPNTSGSIVVSTQVSDNLILIDPGSYALSLWVMDGTGQLDAVSYSIDVSMPLPTEPLASPVFGIAPAGSITDEVPNFKWQHQDSVDAYQIWIRDDTENIDLFLESYEANVLCAAMVCEFTASDLTLIEGNQYQYRLRARNQSGWNQWSEPTNFQLDLSSVFTDIPLQSSITRVQPMTGIVLWANSHNTLPIKLSNEYIQLEYSYVKPSDVVIGENEYDWSTLETLLEDIRIRGHQAILRWYYAYPGEETVVPEYLKQLDNYNETFGITEGKVTHFPDWRSEDLQSAHLAFYSAFAERYDNDPRIAFLQIGFGLWSEYHIYQPGATPGNNFPSAAFQTEFLTHIENEFDELTWSVSIDSGSSNIAPISIDEALLDLSFGLFDDSFMHQGHGSYNATMWDNLGHSQRYATSPHGGELSYYTAFDQQNALRASGIHGRTYEQLSKEYNISYMIGNDQPGYHSNERIKEAGMSNGYRFIITSYQASSTTSRLTVENKGIAPIYYDAYVTLDNIRARKSLKGLLPGQTMEVEIQVGGSNATVSIQSDRLVDGQTIQFEADL